MLYLTNSFSLNMVKDVVDRRGFVDISIGKLDWADVLGNIAFAIEDGDKIIPAIGHSDTANIITSTLRNELDQLLGVVKALGEDFEWYYTYVNRQAEAIREFLDGQWYNRINVSATPEDTIIVFQYTGARLPEGATQLPDGAKIEPYMVHIEIYGENAA